MLAAIHIKVWRCRWDMRQHEKCTFFRLFSCYWRTAGPVPGAIIFMPRKYRHTSSLQDNVSRRTLMSSSSLPISLRSISQYRRTLMRSSRLLILFRSISRYRRTLMRSSRLLILFRSISRYRRTLMRSSPISAQRASMLRNFSQLTPD